MLLGPAILAALALFFVVGPAAAHLVGRVAATPVLGALLAAPIVALYRYGIDGRPPRRAVIEGVVTGGVVAFIYWFVWIRPRPDYWWLEESARYRRGKAVEVRPMPGAQSSRP